MISAGPAKSPKEERTNQRKHWRSPRVEWNDIATDLVRSWLRGKIARQLIFKFIPGHPKTRITIFSHLGFPGRGLGRRKLVLVRIQDKMPFKYVNNVDPFDSEKTPPRRPTSFAQALSDPPYIFTLCTSSLRSPGRCFPAQPSTLPNYRNDHTRENVLILRIPGYRHTQDYFCSRQRCHPFRSPLCQYHDQNLI
ncbi:hypothetical protein OG21DRAFT_148518 [Imleria badia]|nr:hypothetical protein OG21DRAFT_148518 [Imleria badia]